MKTRDYEGVLKLSGALANVVHPEEKTEIEIQKCRICGSVFTKKPSVAKASMLLGGEGITISSLMTLCPKCRSRELFSDVLLGYRG